jgi:hypothetical protein
MHKALDLIPSTAKTNKTSKHFLKIRNSREFSMINDIYKHPQLTSHSMMED